MNAEHKALKTEVADYKRRRIREEASHLIHALGYESTTLDAVAERLQVTKPFIYSYYRNKGEILFEICQMGISLSLDALHEALASGGSARERLRMVVDRVARIVLDNQEYIVIYEREEKNLEPADARREGEPGEGGLKTGLLVGHGELLRVPRRANASGRRAPRRARAGGERTRCR